MNYLAPSMPIEQGLSPVPRRDRPSASWRLLALDSLPIMLVVLAFWATTLVSELQHPWRSSLGFYCRFVVLAVLIAVLFRLVPYAWLARPGGPKRPREALDELRAFLTPEGLGYSALMACATVLFFMSFGAWKQHIAAAGDLRWDLALMKLDRALHGGVEPWRLLDPLMHFPILIHAVDHVYWYWYPITGVVFFCHAALRAGPRRMQFMLSYFVAWVLLGVVVATALGSGGPCYFHQVVGGPDPYGPLLPHLGRVGARARVLQASLWQAYAARRSVAFDGIAAMPSMHVGVAALIALSLWSPTRSPARAPVLEPEHHDR